MPCWQGLFYSPMSRQPYHFRFFVPPLSVSLFAALHRYLVRVIIIISFFVQCYRCFGVWPDVQLTHLFAAITFIAPSSGCLMWRVFFITIISVASYSGFFSLPYPIIANPPLTNSDMGTPAGNVHTQTCCITWQFGVFGPKKWFWKFSICLWFVFFAPCCIWLMWAL